MDNSLSTYADSGIIKDMTVNCYTIPCDKNESDGTATWDKTTMLTVKLFAADTSGFGYSYTTTAAMDFIRKNLRDHVVGQQAFDAPGIIYNLKKKSRNAGLPGIASTAVSAIDIALWDLRAKILRVPVYVLAGARRQAVRVYGSGGFTSYSNEELRTQFEGWMRKGITMFKMKIGRDKEKDEERISYARHVIGEGNLLFIDANGAYFPREALRYLQRFRKYRITWFEEPVTSDNLNGLKFVRDHSPRETEIAAGEYGYNPGYFREMLDRGSVDVLQADATRCGGITGFLQADALCQAFHVPLSAHTSPTVHLHACCAANKAVHIEYFHDHERIEEMLFDGFVKPSDGSLRPDPLRPGLGIEFREKDAEKFLV